MNTVAQSTMLVRVKFEKLEHAESVAEHLYGVKKENNCLIFADADFDKEAFSLAAALEGVEGWEYEIRSEKDDLARQNFNASVMAHLSPQQAVRIYNPPKYVVKISFFPVPHSFPLLFETDPFSFILLTNSAPRFFARLHNGQLHDDKELLVDIAIDTIFAEFMVVFLNLTNDFVSLSEKINKATLTAKNIGTRNVAYFLTLFCDNQPQTIQFYPKNVVIERVLFDRN